MLITKKIGSKTFDPKRILATKDPSMLLGRLIGIARSVVDNEAPDGKILSGAKGQFRFTDAHTGEVTTSSVLYFPTDLGDGVLDELRDGAELIEFAFDVLVQRADNPAGYARALDSLFAEAADSGLERLAAKAHDTKPVISAQADLLLDGPEAANAVAVPPKAKKA